MARDSRYDILFEPVAIGPVTTKNRFYQVPHCNGMGHRYPQAMSEMRGVKAEGGWGVICTEECEIHPSSDLSGVAEMRLWDDSDLPIHELVVEKVHAGGALAGIELAHNSFHVANRYSRMPPLAPSDLPVDSYDPVQARAMSASDIRDLRRWHRKAALRSKRAGYDIVYVYAGHNMSLLQHFLLPRYNRRSDEYGGSLENRVRLIREILTDTKEAVGDRCGVAFRFAVDELRGDAGLLSDGEGREVVEMLAELPDLWDVNVADWSNDSLTSRFAKEGFQEDHIRFVKQVTGKPVVGVGRFTSPDTMVSQVRRGVLDLIGAARPSIADPFLPKKIDEGRPEEIRECIGCNICVSGDFTAAPMRCTQNPTVSEEWRKGWHPDKVPAAGSEDSVLIIGGGPAGLEAALTAGRRGYRVVLAESAAELGGRVLLESRLPGLSEWKRVADHRTYMLSQMANVNCYPESALSADQVREFGFERVLLATGAAWRDDGLGRNNTLGIASADGAGMISPDRLLQGEVPEGPVLIFDDDHFYLAGLLAEQMKAAGLEVHLATPASLVSAFTENTLEQHRIQSRLISLGIHLHPNRNLREVSPGRASLACVFGGGEEELSVASVVPVTARRPNDALYHELAGDPEALAAAGIKSVTRVGDCFAPGTIAAAVYAGHLNARQLDDPRDLWVDFQREKRVCR